MSTINAILRSVFSYMINKVLIIIFVLCCNLAIDPADCRVFHELVSFAPRSLEYDSPIHLKGIKTIIGYTR